MVQKYDDDQVVVTNSAVVIMLTDEQKKQAEECLKRSGEVKISFKEIKVTSLPAATSALIAVD